MFARFWHKTLGFASEAASGGSKSWKNRVPGTKPWAPLRRLPPVGQNPGKIGFLAQNRLALTWGGTPPTLFPRALWGSPKGPIGPGQGAWPSPWNWPKTEVLGHSGTTKRVLDPRGTICPPWNLENSTLKTIPKQNHVFGALLRGSGALLRDPGALLRDPGALLRDSGALLRDSGALLQSLGALLQSFGALLQTFGALLQTVGALLQTFLVTHPI